MRIPGEAASDDTVRKGGERLLLSGTASELLRLLWLAGPRRRSERSRRRARGGLQSSGSATKPAGEPHAWRFMAEAASRMANRELQRAK